MLSYQTMKELFHLSFYERRESKGGCLGKTKNSLGQEYTYCVMLKFHIQPYISTVFCDF